MRYILLDLGNADKDELYGKDIALTDAPKSILEETSNMIKTSTYSGLPAEEVFLKEVTAKGYVIRLINIFDEFESYVASADNY